MHQRRRAAADNFRIGVLRNQSKSTVSKMMYKGNAEGDGNADYQFDDESQRLRLAHQPWQAWNRGGAGGVQIASQNEAGDDKSDQCRQAEPYKPPHFETIIPICGRAD